MSEFDNVSTFPTSNLWTADKLIDLADTAYRAGARNTSVSAIEALYALFDKAAG